MCYVSGACAVLLPRVLDARVLHAAARRHHRRHVARQVLVRAFCCGVRLHRIQFSVVDGNELANRGFGLRGFGMSDNEWNEKGSTSAPLRSQVALRSLILLVALRDWHSGAVRFANTSTIDHARVTSRLPFGSPIARR